MAATGIADTQGAMPLHYFPRRGEIVMCHYDDRVIEPEMRKTRPVVVIGPRLRRRGRLVTVIPLSTSVPDPVEAYHRRIILTNPLPAPFDSPEMWAKCDMIATVSIDRLDRFKEARARYGGSRQWTTRRLSDVQLDDVQAGMLCGLGLEFLTKVTPKVT